MRKYIKYFLYVLRHKYYVSLECFKFGLYWRGIMHDMSKLLPSEFIPYAKYFYGEKKETPDGNNCFHCVHVSGSQCTLDGSGIGDGTVAQVNECVDYAEKPGLSYNVKDGIFRGRDTSGAYRAGETVDDEFNFAWLLHQKRNPHHWQWWVLSLDDGGTKIFAMDWESEIEMICDWVGAGKAMGKFSPAEDPYQETRKWYEANKSHMQLDRATRMYVEMQIGLVKSKSEWRRMDIQNNS